ncbi:MAG TPA: ATP-binding protein [Iamia sp.]|nr:ATP-binding protein [Iamia sp.]
MADDLLPPLVDADAPPAALEAPPPDPHHVLVAVALAASTEAASQARHVVRDLLQQGHRLDMVDTACLLTSELVANAIIHADGAVELVVDLDRARLAVEVIDASSEPPVVIEAEPVEVERLATSGRGLAMVARLADAWGVTRVVPGKSVWFSITA